MQAFSGMQRSLSHQNALSLLIVFGLYTVYVSLGSIYLLLPPMAAVLLYAYHDALKSNDLFRLIVTAGMLLVYEAEKGFWFGSSILMFTLLSRFLFPRLEQLVQCRFCMAGIYVLLAYPAYWVSIWITDKILLISVPGMDWHMVLYMLIEFLILAAAI